MEADTGVVVPTALGTPGVSAWRRLWRRSRSIVSFLIILVVLIGAWEGYKALWTALDWSWPVRPDNSAMPHTWDIIDSLFSPAQRGNDTLLITILLEAALFTLREAFIGFVIGSVVGFSIAVAFDRFRILERAFLPYVIASQTVPLIAIAPIVVIWGGRAEIPLWFMVSLISAYLTFFPVTVNTLRGLRSPEATATELMRSYAAHPRQVLWKLKLPAAVPYLFTAFKVAATISIVGAIVGELPAGLRDGLGRQLLNFSYYYISGPEKLYGAVLVSALAGFAFVGVVALAERLIVGRERMVQ